MKLLGKLAATNSRLARSAKSINSILLRAWIGVVFALLSGMVHAQTLNWVNWTNPGTYPNSNANPAYTYTNGANGTLTLPDTTVVNVALTGEVMQFSCFAATVNNCATGWWRSIGGWGPSTNYPAGTFTSANVPSVPNNANMIAQAGYVPAVARHTLTFDRPVTNIVMNVVSLGSPSNLSAYKFDQDFTVLSQDTHCTGSLTNPVPAAYCLSVSGRTLTGAEGSGTLQFTGTFTSISWEVTVPEVFSGFNIGVTSASFAAQAPLTLTANPAGVLVGGSSNLSASGGSGTGAITYTLISGPCTLSGSTLTGTGAGNCVVTATKAGDGTYASLTTDPVTVSVGAQFTVTYNGNGNTTGAPPTDGNSYNSNAAVTVLGASTLARTGYGFSGWNTAANGSGTSYAPSASFNITASTTLYAQWVLNTYTVSYDANGAASGTAPAAQTKTHGVNLLLATNAGNLARPGYSFTGWNTAADGMGTDYSPGATYSANAAVTLYVKWAEVIDGVCGSAHNPAASPLLSAPPSANLCSAGVASAVSPGTQNYTWQCQGSNGGLNPSCQAPRGYVVTPSAGSNGSLSPQQPQTVAYGATLTLTAVPGAGYLTSSITGCSGAATGSGVNSFTTGPVTENCTVAASFATRTADTGSSATGTGPITISMGGGGAQCGLADIAYEQAGSVAGAAPDGYHFVHGLVRFNTSSTCTPNGSVTITITYPQAVPARAKFFKYGPATAGAAPGWYEHPATISGNTVTYSVTDNGQGDSNPAAGTIADPAGIAVRDGSGAHPVPALGTWALLLLGTLLGGLGLHRTSRQRG